MKDFKITTSDSPQEWSYWCREKSGNVLEHLARMADAILRLQQGTERETLEENLHPAVWDAIKLVAFSTGHTITGTELGEWREEICTVGSAAFPSVAAALGLEVPNPNLDHNENLREFLTEADACLSLPRSEGRSRLHRALLRAAKEGGSIINSLLERMELVTLGELGWETFVQEARPVVDNLRKLNNL
jgi:hypothetical protein